MARKQKQSKEGDLAKYFKTEISESDGEDFSKSDSETGSASDTEIEEIKMNEDETEEKSVEGKEAVDSDDSQESVASRHPWEIKNE